jgi:hypothetical protein
MQAVRIFLTGARRYMTWQNKGRLIRSGMNVRERIALSVIAGKKTCAQP